MTATTVGAIADLIVSAMDATQFPSDRASAISRLTSFAASAGEHYANNRSFDLGPDRRDNVSLLSPYLRHRLVLESEVLEATLQVHSLVAADKFVQEVFWRAYFKGWLEHRPSVWATYRASVAELLHTMDEDRQLLDRYETATAGETGIDCFDAWVTELVRTGYLHNHARMWFASIWVYTLELPWELGADFFYRHLIDGDPASNTLSWRWVCGLHTRGKTYLARASNIVSYTGDRFNPGGRLATSAPPLVESTVFPVSPLRDSAAPPGDGRYGLLITEEDGHPESLFPEARPLAIAGAIATRKRSPLPVGRPAIDFAAGAVSDALERANRHFDADAEMVAIDDWANELIDWAAARRIDTIVTAYAPVGPVAERLDGIAERLGDYGIRLIQIRRKYDTVSWPFATRGYFKLKTRIPEMLQRLEIAYDGTKRREAS